MLSQTKCSNVQINLKQLKKWVNLISDLYFKTDSYLYFSNGIFQQFQLKRSCHSELNDKGEKSNKDHCFNLCSNVEGPLTYFYFIIVLRLLVI